MGGGTPILSIVGTSGTGKTTLLEKLIPELRRRGYRVAVIKHHPHPGLEVDPPGKDTWRLGRAGADHVVLVTPEQVVHRWHTQEEAPLETVAAAIQGADLILTEGYKNEPFPKIEVYRRGHSRDLVSHPDQLLALATDVQLDLPVPQFSLDDVEGLADLIEHTLLAATGAPPGSTATRGTSRRSAKGAP